MQPSEDDKRDACRQDVGELEWVDAECPDEPPLVDVARGAPATHREALPGVLDLERLGADAVERLRRGARRRTSTPVEPPAAWGDQRLEAISYCVIDLETTGATHGHDDEILEIGAVQLNGFELGREFVTLVDPARPISWAAHRVHGIDRGEIVASPRLEQALPWLLETTRHRVLVFHNAGFDLGFLQRAMLESGREPFTQPVLDTLLLARRVLGGRCALSVLAQRLGLEAERAHRALSDARTTAQLLVFLLRLCQRAGLETLRQVPALSNAGRQRGRRHARRDPLLERLELAVRRGESLRLGYHAGAGVAPLELQVRPLQLRGGLQLDAYDEFLARHVQLDVQRIRDVRPAP